jgi:hypothetical protein
VPVRSLYRFFDLGPTANVIRVDREFHFEKQSLASAFRPYMPRLSLSLGFDEVKYPTTGGTPATVNVVTCPDGCIQSNWDPARGWFAIHNPTSGTGVIVRRGQNGITPQLWVDYDGASSTNASSFLLLPPAGGFTQEVTETMALCFYNSTIWPAASQQSLTLPAGCEAGPQPTNLTFTADNAKSSDFDDPAQVAATLTTSSGQPVPNETVKFTLTPGGPSGTPTCSATADASGKAGCAITPNQKAGSYTLTAAFAGDASFAASQTSAAFTVGLEETTLHYSGALLFANGTPVKLSASLSEDGTTPIFMQPGGAGSPRTVSFTLGTGSSAQGCSGTTDASGTASCSITVNQPLGPSTVQASFASDGYYQSATDSKSALVFAYLGGGFGNGTSFVIGDKNAVSGNAVTFWGGQWASHNSLSGGPAPAAFRGFASHTSTTPPSCGGSWTKTRGPSSRPPASVPSYIAVIASSSISRSGTTTSGDAPHIVIVKTNPGYAANPSHPGTGTVVAVLC